MGIRNVGVGHLGIGYLGIWVLGIGRGNWMLEHLGVEHLQGGVGHLGIF